VDRPTRPVRLWDDGSRLCASWLGPGRLPARALPPASRIWRRLWRSCCSTRRREQRSGQAPTDRHRQHVVPWRRPHELHPVRRGRDEPRQGRCLVGLQAVLALVLRLCPFSLRTPSPRSALIRPPPSLLLQAIKESTGERGWVPSWFIGSQPPSAAAPAGGAGSTASDGVPQTPRVFGSPSGRIEPAVTTAAVDGDGGLRPGMF
jgi:hypothetical protein